MVLTSGEKNNKEMFIKNDPVENFSFLKMLPKNLLQLSSYEIDYHKNESKSSTPCYLQKL